MAYKTIGVLGGMGPAASAAFYSKIITLAQQKYNAVQDTDYPPMIIYSLPLYGFDESGIVNKEQVFYQVVKGIKTLENAGCDFIVIVCNTIHCFIDELKGITAVPILNLLEETAKKVNGDGINQVALIASETTLSSGIYTKVFHDYGINSITPPKNEWGKITAIIAEVMAGTISSTRKNHVLNIIEQLGSKTKVVVLGCTELPLAITQKDTNIKIYDTLTILAEAVLEYAVKGKL